jgi:hypothetical protein
MRQNHPAGSGESHGQAEPVQPNVLDRSQANADIVVSERQSTEMSHLAAIAASGDLRSELRGTKVLEAVVAGVVVAIAISVFLGGLVTGVIAVVAIAVREYPSADRPRPPGSGCGISPADGGASPLTSLLSGTRGALLAAATACGRKLGGP